MQPVQARPSLTPMAARMLRRARERWSRREFEAAGQALANVLSLSPDHPEALRMMGMVAQRLGDHARAVDCFRRVLPTWPRDADLQVGLGIALYESGRVGDAVDCLREACRLAPTSALAWFNLGEAIGREAQTDEAIDALQRALELDPTHVPARLSLARAQANLGQVDAAVAGFREVLRADGDNAEAWFGLSNLNTVRFDVDDAAHLERALAREGQPIRDRELLGFAFAKALESRGDYSRAFDVFHAANASRRQRVHWDAAGEHRRVEAIRQVFGDLTLPPPSDVSRGREVIFVVSIPRSGSTLVEQILASHPDVEGANEIKDLREVIDAETRRRASAFPLWVPQATAADWQRMGAAYLDRTARWRAARPRFTDKSLVNWYSVGAALAMLPAARVVVVRRDPVETCLGCFRQCFSEASGFACDLDEMADYCADFLRLTRFWLETYPERVFDLAYESLVAEPEATIRELLAFCELSFDPACLAFHETRRSVLSLPSAAQVRQPMRRDTARSALYGNKLDALRRRLHEAGVAS